MFLIIFIITLSLSLSLSTLKCSIYVLSLLINFVVFTTCSENDKAHIKLAAAKAILRLARKWDLHITPQTFQFCILIAKVCILNCLHVK